MKAGCGGLFGLVMASPSLSLIILLNIYLLRCSVSEFCPCVFRGRIDCRGTIVALEVSTACDISLPSLFMGLRTRPRNSFVDGN